MLCNRAARKDKLPSRQKHGVAQQHHKIQPNLCLDLMLSTPKSCLPTSTATTLHFTLEKEGEAPMHTWAHQCPAVLLLSRGCSRTPSPTQASVGGHKIHQATAQSSAKSSDLSEHGEHPFHACCSPLQEPLFYSGSRSIQRGNDPLGKEKALSSQSRRGKGGPAQGPPERAEVFDSAASVSSTSASLFSGKGDGKWDVLCACPSWVWQRPNNLKTRGKKT